MKMYIFLRSRSKPSILLFESRTICTHSESLIHTMERNLRCFIPSRLQLENLKFWLFGLFNNIYYLNTSSCALIVALSLYFSDYVLFHFISILLHFVLSGL